jgi:P27 family predicted phage terminase small subunit
MPNNPGQGRKPKPTHLKLLEGEVNKHRINFDEPKPTPEAPKCPVWLSKEGRKEWKRLAPEMERLGLLTKADFAMFAAYCSAVGKLAWAEREIKKRRNYELKKIKTQNLKESEVPTTGGMVDQAETKKGYTTLPAVWIYNKSLEQIRSFGSEFGLSPSSRTRIKTSDLDDGDDDLLTR